MENEVSGKLTEVLDGLQKVANQITDKLVETAPKAYEIILTLKRIDSLQQVLIFLGAFLLSFGFFKLRGVLYKKYDPKDYNTDGWMIGSIFSSIFSGVFLIFALIRAFNIWIWIGVFQPDLAIAKDVYDSVLAATNGGL